MTRRWSEKTRADLEWVVARLRRAGAHEAADHVRDAVLGRAFRPVVTAGATPTVTGWVATVAFHARGVARAVREGASVERVMTTYTTPGDDEPADVLAEVAEGSHGPLPDHVADDVRSIAHDLPPLGLVVTVEDDDGRTEAFADGGVDVIGGGDGRVRAGVDVERVLAALRTRVVRAYAS